MFFSFSKLLNGEISFFLDPMSSKLGSFSGYFKTEDEDAEFFIISNKLLPGYSTLLA